MPSYNVIKSDGTTLAIVADGVVVSTASSIKFIGRTIIDYGQDISENQVHIMENFSNITSPLLPIEGQLWWKSDINVLKIFDGTNFINLASEDFVDTAIGDFVNTAIGDFVNVTGDTMTGDLVMDARIKPLNHLDVSIGSDLLRFITVFSNNFEGTTFGELDLAGGITCMHIPNGQDEIIFKTGGDNERFRIENAKIVCAIQVEFNADIVMAGGSISSPTDPVVGTQVGDRDFNDARYITFPSGTLMLFQQTSAPTGWTKQTTHNNKALRIVSGAASSAGTTAFTTVFGAGKTAGSHILTTGEIPAHTHTQRAKDAVAGGSGGSDGTGDANNANAGETLSTGGGGSHNHTLSLDLQYVDLIIASKD